jgi:hypothetical protein
MLTGVGCWCVDVSALQTIAVGDPGSDISCKGVLRFGGEPGRPRLCQGACLVGAVPKVAVLNKPTLSMRDTRWAYR